MLNRLTLDEAKTAFAETMLTPCKARFLSPSPDEDVSTCWSEAEYGCVLGAIAAYRIGKEQAAELYYHKGLSKLCEAINLNTSYAVGLYCGWDAIGLNRQANDDEKTGYEDGCAFRHAILNVTVA